MSASLSYLATLPTEILEKICLYLPGRDMIKMEAVSRYFRDIFRDSTILQHRRQLFTAGLIDDPSISCDLPQRRKACEEYVRKWSGAGTVVKSDYKLPQEILSDSHAITILGGNILASQNSRDHTVNFVRVPTAASQKPIERWTLPPLPFSTKRFAAHVPDGVLAVTEVKEECVYVHLLNLMDGSAYRTPPSNVISWSFPTGIGEVSVRWLVVTSFRLAMFISRQESLDDDEQAGRVLVWDWRTGGLVLDISSVGGKKLDDYNTRVTFLDEFRIIFYVRNHDGYFAGFVLFNTLLQQGRPGSSLRFHAPPIYHKSAPSAYFDRHLPLPLRAFDHHGPLIVDPTQAIHVICFSRSGRGHYVVLAFRVQALIERACSLSTNTDIFWHEWQGGSVALVVPDPGNSSVLVQGLHVITVTPHVVYRRYGAQLCLRIFDFGLRACGSFSGIVKCDESVRAAWDKDGRIVFLEESEDLEEDKIESLGNGIFFYLDKNTYSGPTLHVWELI